MKRTIVYTNFVAITTAKKIRTIFHITLLMSLSILSAETTQERNETLLFQTTATLHATEKHKYQNLYKGSTISFPVQENARYAALITSQSLDSVLQLGIEGKNIFRDIFLGEDAGIVFTPFLSSQSSDENNAQMQTQKNETSSKVTITALFHPPEDKNSDASHNSIELGEYTISVYRITPQHTIEAFPFVENSAMLTNEDSIIGRIAREYTMRITKNTRLYAFMESKDFDTLLEFSNTYGEVVASDDWIKTDESSASLLSLVIPQDDTYVIMPTSFSGLSEGAFSLRVFTTENENVFSESTTLTKKDTKIFTRYIREYPLSLQAEDARTISLNTLSGNVEVIFARADRSALHTEKVKNGTTKDIPIFVTEAGDYKIIIASDGNLPAHYSIALYK